MKPPALPARRIDWLDALLADEARLGALLERWGSPLHLHRPERLAHNGAVYQEAAAAQGVALDLFFARKANKALAYVAAAREAGLGVDVASEQELRQTLDAGVAGPRIVVTAALKSPALLRLALARGACVVVDHLAEIAAVREAARTTPASAPFEIALRLRGFALPSGPHLSRFGVHFEQLPAAVEALRAARADGVRTAGLHFHLDGYAAADRAAALDRCIALAPVLRDEGLPIRFVDIGGGFPVNYAASGDDWRRFLRELDRALAGDRPPITFRNTGFGRQLAGAGAFYPHAQTPTGAAWLARVVTPDRARRLRDRDLSLRAEPGRALLEDCGATVARVEFVKPGAGSTLFVGVAMNSSSCRTRKSELLTDPLHRPGPGARGPACEGHVVGAYCAEDDLITSRLLAFPEGVAAGDLLVFPNTAGYYMHFTESRSHQLPLPLNVVVGAEATADRLDAIGGWRSDDRPAGGAAAGLPDAALRGRRRASGDRRR